MRISSAILLGFALAACGQKSDEPAATARALDNAQAAVARDDWIACAHGGAGAFTRDCTVERTQTAGGLILTVRHADNGFHRLLVVDDGRGVIAADGAEQAKVSMLGDGRIEVAIGGDRYRLPATVKGQKAAK